MTVLVSVVVSCLDCGEVIGEAVALCIELFVVNIAYVLGIYITGEVYFALAGIEYLRSEEFERRVR